MQVGGIKRRRGKGWRGDREVIAVIITNIVINVLIYINYARITSLYKDNGMDQKLHNTGDTHKKYT